MVIEWLPIGDVKPYWRNPRKNDRAVAKVRESLDRFGWQQPLVVDAKGVIIAGHTRYRAASERGDEKVPCVRAKLTAAKARQYRIADNRSAEYASWDGELLAAEIAEITDTDFLDVFDIQELLEHAASGPSAADLANRENELANQYSGKAVSMIDVMCPHCGGEFKIDRDQVLKEPADRVNDRD